MAACNPALWLAALLAAAAVLPTALGSHLTSDEDMEEDEEEELMHSDHIPQIKSEPQHFNVTVGSTIILPCKIDDLGGFVSLWYKGDQVLYTGLTNVFNNNRINLTDVYSLKIMDVGLPDSGNYSCQIASNPPLRLTHFLTVIAPPLVSLIPSGKVVVKEGDGFSVTCHARGSPTPNITWYIKGERRQSTDNTLTVMHATPGDAGDYTCVAENGVGAPVRETVVVNVIGNLKMFLKTRWIHSERGELPSVELLCHADAVPPPKLSWLHANGSTVRESRRVSTARSETKSVLTIHRVTPEDFSIYQCRATVEGETYSQTIPLSGIANPISVTYHEATDTMPHLLKWTVESYSPVEVFAIKYRKAGESAWVEHEVKGSEHSFELKKLELNAKYEVTMMANNKYGWNEASEPLVFTVKKPAPNSARASASQASIIITCMMLLRVMLNE